MIDLAFFTSNATKITHGGWFPLVVAGIAFTLMTTWKKGRRLVREDNENYSTPLAETLESLANDDTNTRVPGVAVFIHGNSQSNRAPLAFTLNLKYNSVIHRHTVFLSIVGEDVPRVPNLEKLQIDDLGHGFTSVRARFGYMELPNIPTILTLASAAGTPQNLVPEDLSYFVSRERIFYQKGTGFSRWREGLFAFMTRNAQGSSDYYKIPPNQVVELGTYVYV